MTVEVDVDVTSSSWADTKAATRAKQTELENFIVVGKTSVDGVKRVKSV
jgi:hypothetical protein